MPPIPEFEAKIEKLIFGGKALARHESGKVVFVIGDCLPGEMVKLRVFKKNKDYMNARVIDRLSTSDERIDAPCPYFGRCGGCTLQSLAYENQLKTKQSYIEETFRSFISKELNVSVRPIIASPEQWRYRHKLELTFFPENDDLISLGFYYKGTWFKVVDIDDCLLFDKRVKPLLLEVRDWFKQYKLTAFHHRNFDGLLRNLIIRHAQSTDEWMIGLVTTDEELDIKIFDNLIDRLQKIVSLKSFLWRVIKVKRKKGEQFTDTHIFGEKFIVEKLAGLNYQVRLQDFFQNNVKQADNMVTAVINELKLDSSVDSVLDLYCGVGTFTLPLAKHLNAQVTGVEIVQSAIDSAKHNAKINSINGIKFICKDISRIIDEVLSEQKYDAIVVDPPRAGLTKKVIEGLLISGSKKIVYVSCNPSTLARDLEMLSEKYIIKYIQPFDLFPQTYHVECIAGLELK